MIAFLVIMILVFILLLSLFLFPYVKKYVTKKYFNHLVARKLYTLAKDEDYYLLNNLVLDLGDNMVVHINHLLSGEKYIYVIADRYLAEGVDGALEDNTLFIYDKGHRKEIKNPVLVNETRSLELAKYLNWTEDKPPMVISVVVTNNDCLIPDHLSSHGSYSYLTKLKKLYSIIRNNEYNSPEGKFSEENLKNMVMHLNELSEEALKKGLK